MLIVLAYMIFLLDNNVQFYIIIKVPAGLQTSIQGKEL